jgi:hypothetical protein
MLGEKLGSGEKDRLGLVRYLQFVEELVVYGI